MSYARIKPGEIEVGRPVPWSLFDTENHLLLARGVVLESERQLQILLERGLFRKLNISDAKPAGDDAAQASGRQDETLAGLDAIRLEIGDTLQLQSQAEGASVRYYVKLIGYLKGKSVVVTTPVVDGKVALIREGQAFVVRMFSGKSVYAFPASVFKVVNTPYPHLHLTYPGQVRGLVVRRGARARVNVIAAVQDAEARSHAATIVNLSTGGALLLAKSPLGVKDDVITVKFRVIVSDVEKFITVQAIIRAIHSATHEDGDLVYMHHGVQFLDVEHSEQVTLAAYVYQRLFEESAGN
ncbi:MAG: flagellar brake protein [Zoogloea sp.]|nr:flagellar brake protein [Zoogloea sp.]